MIKHSLDFDFDNIAGLQTGNDMNSIFTSLIQNKHG